MKLRREGRGFTHFHRLAMANSATTGNVRKAEDIPEEYKNPDDDQKGPYVLVDITAPLMAPSLVFEWHGNFPPEGRCWRYTAGRLTELEKQGAIVFSRAGRPRLKRHFGETEGREEPKDDLATYWLLVKSSG